MLPAARQEVEDARVQAANPRSGALRQVRAARSLRAARDVRRARPGAADRDGGGEEGPGRLDARRRDRRALRLPRLPAARSAAAAGRLRNRAAARQSRAARLPAQARGRGRDHDVGVLGLGAAREGRPARRPPRHLEQDVLPAGAQPGRTRELGDRGALGRGRPLRDIVRCLRRHRHGARGDREALRQPSAPSRSRSRPSTPGTATRTAIRSRSTSIRGSRRPPEPLRSPGCYPLRREGRTR